MLLVSLAVVAAALAGPLVTERAAAAPRRAPAATLPWPKPVGVGFSPLELADTTLEPVDWTDLHGWAGDDHAAAFAAFLVSCRPIVRGDPRADPRPVRAGLLAACRKALTLRDPTPERTRDFFERMFRPMRITRIGEPAGFLTGYYEPVLEGSRVPTQVFKVPIHRRPLDLVAPGHQPGQPFPNRGPALRITASGEQVPYYDRAEIENGALDGRRLEICWVREPSEVLNIQIQGSARVRLEDGTLLRLNYDGHNGQRYTPVGRVLIERGIIPREEMSMARIRDWMVANPVEAREVRQQNRSYVFFRIVGLDDEREPIGAQGVRLTAGRSIAVDRALHVYGTPFFISADLPMTAPKSADPLHRVWIAQDTGSAIVGPARADLYLGAGDEAGRVAGRIRSPGRFAMLVPREIDPEAMATRVPLPRLRPPPPPPPPPVATKRPIRRAVR